MFRVNNKIMINYFNLFYFDSIKIIKVFCINYNNKRREKKTEYQVLLTYILAKLTTIELLLCAIKHVIKI